MAGHYHNEHLSQELCGSARDSGTRLQGFCEHGNEHLNSITGKEIY
jgi:hypothetical protein